METREQRQARAIDQARTKAESKRLWLEGVSNGLDSAWVSVCPHAQTHKVVGHPLLEIVDTIRSGDDIKVPGKFGQPRYVNIEEHQIKVQRLYQDGVEEARTINRVLMVRLLDRMGIQGVLPEEVEVELDQPKKNVKLFYVRALKIKGDRIQVNEPDVVWHRPTDLGKAKADDAKKWGPAVCLSGLFMPHRDGQYLIRATGLFPIDVDGFADERQREDKRREIERDEHVALLFASITGSGLRACVLGPECKNARDYEQCYRRIARDKAAKWRIEAQIDDHTCDVSRLCFMPYDEAIFYQP